MTSREDQSAPDPAGVAEGYIQHVNAGLAALFKFMGFDAVEWRA